MSFFEPGNRHLSVLLDIRQPLAYLALHPAAALALECGTRLDLLPIDSPVLKPPSPPGPDDDRGIRHRRHRAHAVSREIEIYAQAQGLVLESYYRNPDPAPFNIAWLWIAEQHRDHLLAFLAEGFRAYWADEFDPSDLEAVRQLVDSISASGGNFAKWSQHEGPASANALADELMTQGLSRAPCYLIEDEVFVGRQHLPMIRWILEGRTGPRPI